MITIFYKLHDNNLLFIKKEYIEKRSILIKELNELSIFKTFAPYDQKAIISKSENFGIITTQITSFKNKKEIPNSKIIAISIKNS